MNYTETYVVETVFHTGAVEVDPHDDMEAALNAYKLSASLCRPGESVKLHRTTSVIIMSKVRA